MAQLKARRDQEDVPRARPGLGGARRPGGSRRRSAATPRTASGWRWSPTAARRPPATGSASGSPDWTLLELDLVTGRTHQIRVHLAALGHPVAGDPVYGTGTSRKGPDGLERLFLHAWRLELVVATSGAADPRRGAAARRSWRPCWSGCAARRGGPAAGAAGSRVTERPTSRACRRRPGPCS